LSTLFLFFLSFFQKVHYSSAIISQQKLLVFATADSLLAVFSHGTADERAVTKAP
jgi:hypothetical protein